MNGLQHAQDIQKEKKRTSQPTEEEDEFEEFNDHSAFPKSNIAP
jgi:hypothetical protein